MLHAVRDRLSVEEAADLASQLPMVIRGLYYEGWRPAGKPDKMKRGELLVRVGDEIERGLVHPEIAVRVVLDVVARHVTPGEMADVRHAFPKAMQDLVP